MTVAGQEERSRVDLKRHRCYARVLFRVFSCSDLFKNNERQAGEWRRNFSRRKEVEVVKSLVELLDMSLDGGALGPADQVFVFSCYMYSRIRADLHAYSDIYKEEEERKKDRKGMKRDTGRLHEHVPSNRMQTADGSMFCMRRRTRRERHGHVSTDACQ